MSGHHFGCHNRLGGGYYHLMVGRGGASKYLIMYRIAPTKNIQPQMLIRPTVRNSDIDDELERYLKQ